MNEPSATVSPDDADLDVEFYFDPICPFAWQTSKWIRLVRAETGIAVRWRFLSLYFLNKEDTDEPLADEEHAAGHAQSLRWHRVLAAVKASGRPDLIDPLYEAWTSERYERPAGSGDPRSDESILEEFGLPSELAAEADNTDWDEVLRAETAEALSHTGENVGTPVLRFFPGGNAYFGPVISSVPTPADAVAIYESLRKLVDFETFSEIKRTKRPPLDLPALTS